MSLNIKLLTQSSNITYDTASPYSYNVWLQFNSFVNDEESINLYNDYLRVWSEIKQNNLPKINAIKQDYINLLKELTHFFSEEEKNLFLKDINFTNDTEIIYSIPYFVQKLKEIALTVSKKRESIKNNTYKYTLLGSEGGLEQIFYEYLLKAYTKSNTNTQLSISSLGTVFPDLSSIKDNFSIEVEDLYELDTDTDNADSYPLISNIPLFNVFNQFLIDNKTDVNSISSYVTYAYSSSSIDSYLYKLNKKYLGNTIHGLSAVKYSLNNANTSINYIFNKGNNWFYWPKGEVFLDVDINKNYFVPIPINNANFTLSGTAGTNYTNSDLIFIESNNNIEAAWLRGSVSTEISGTMVLTTQPEEIRTFIFPTPGYGLTNTYTWTGREIDDQGLVVFNLLDPIIKKDIIKKYFNDNSTILNTSLPLHINKTTLIENGAHANSTSINSDNILKRPANVFSLKDGIYRDDDTTEQAFLYKLTSTELPINYNNNYILWPLISDTQQTNVNSIVSAINFDNFCSSKFLNAIDISKHMTGSVAGLTPDSADVIYKMSGSTGNPIEVAWLHSNSLKSLATQNSFSVDVYDTSAINCIEPIDGAIQPSLNFICKSNAYVSFVWCDIDTLADEVFNYKTHAKDCPFIINYQDYKNNPSKNWSICTCKSTHYSPIGHTGDEIFNNSGITDYLFADPQNLGDEFTLTKWRDTRNLNYKNSPQFSFFQKTDNTVCKDYGWGPGTWKTGNGSKMILKTGRRYTYFRNSILSSSLTTDIPPLLCFYPYKNIISSIQSDITSDIVFLIDISGSEYYTIEKTKELVQKIIEYINTDQGSQISIVAFKNTAAALCYLTTNKTIAFDILDQLTIDAIALNTTNLYAGLDVSQTILTTSIGTNSENKLMSLCSNLTFTTQNSVSLANNINIPDKNNKKTIIILSDGDYNINSSLVEEKILKIKNLNIDCIVVDVGPNSLLNLNSENITKNNTNNYFNYEDILRNYNSSTAKKIASSIILNIFKTAAVEPVWMKGTVKEGNVISLSAASDMVLNPGDYLLYQHRSQINYNGWFTPTSPILIKTPLYGWNYDTKQFDNISLGSKPYWGKSYNRVQENNFNTRFAREFGGHIRYAYTYLPISHPEISTLIFNANDHIEYRNKSCVPFVWKQNLTFNKIENKREWLKLKMCVQNASLRDIFNNNSLDKIVEETSEPSTIKMQTFANFAPAYYCYFAQQRFTFDQSFLNINNTSTFAQIITGIAIQPEAPYANLINTHNTFIYNKLNENNLTTYQDVGGYLLPTTLGVPYYLGYGSVNTLNTSKLENMAKDILYLDPQNYTSNRGLTKQDQVSPYETTYVDNTWIKEPYNKTNKAGVIIDAARYQKFVPYQANFEITNYNPYGISRQSDNFEFWDKEKEWTENSLYPTNFKKEPYLINERIKKLRVTEDTLYSWQTDVFGNNYGLFKTVK